MKRYKQQLGRVRFNAIPTAIAFGFVLFIINVVQNPYAYSPAKVRLMGTAAGEQDASLQWDTGEGFNEYESKPIELSTEAPLPSGSHRLTISSNGRRDPRSQGAEVWISAIKVLNHGEWRTLNWSDVQFSGNYVERGDVRVLLTAGGVATLSLIHISEPTRLLSISYAVF